MTKIPRIDWPGALHHVMTRGHAKDAIFLDDDDRAAWIDITARVLEDSGTQCLAWALMPNHTHKYMESGGVPISRVLQRINVAYAQHFNRTHDRVGHVYQGRFKSVAIENDVHFIRLVAYVHLNPVRGGLVDLAELADYPWTGHGALMGRRPPRLIDVDRVLALFGKTRSEARSGLMSLMERELELDPGGAALLPGVGARLPLSERDQDDLEVRSVSALVGRREYLDRVARQTNERNCWRARLKAGGIGLEAVLARACLEFGADPAAVSHGRRTAPESRARSVAAYLMCEFLGATQEEAGRRLGVSRRAVSYAATRGRALAQRAGIEPGSFLP